MAQTDDALTPIPSAILALFGRSSPMTGHSKSLSSWQGAILIKGPLRPWIMSLHQGLELYGCVT
jgi:hypothetical protein